MPLMAQRQIVFGVAEILGVGLSISGSREKFRFLLRKTYEREQTTKDKMKVNKKNAEVNSLLHFAHKRSSNLLSSTWIGKPLI